MKKEMKKLFVYTMGMFLLSLVTSCGDDKEDTGYTGVNKIYLSAENPVIEEAEATPLTVNVDLTTACEQDVTLNFEVLDDEAGILKLVNNPVTIQAGQKKATFQVVSNQKNLLAVDTYFQIGISTIPVENMALNAVLSVRVKPDPQIPELSEEQLALIEGYKTKYNIDLTDWLGIVSCHTVVNSPADGYLTPFVQAFTKEYDGKTIITLSEEATAEMPVLRMVDNPMGLTEYLYWVFRAETVEDSEYWTESPASQTLMEQINWNKNTNESFSASLNGIKLKDITSSTATVDYIGEGTDSYGDPIKAVPFSYTFSAWTRQQELMKTDPTAQEIYEQGGRAEPDYYLCNTGIDEDGWEDPENFEESTGSIDFTAKKMTFKFLIDHMNAGGYTHVTVTYEKK